MEKSMETKVAETILQRPEEIQIGERTYRVAPPSVATLILASEVASRMPQVKMNPEDAMNETLANARFCRPLGEFVAVLILGAKGIKEEREIEEKIHREWYKRRWRRKGEKKLVEVDVKAELADYLLKELSPRELYELTASLLQRMQVGDFFGLTTFLIETNLTRPTKVVSETTASGR
ncbi:MAG: hypothetical protein NC324_03060 [Bacteroides sp.]|nr:hypothetical protein [Bacteroides sp.]